MEIRNDLKTKIRTCNGDLREAAAYCGITYTRLNMMLNGFDTLKPEIERDVLNYINEKKRAITCEY
jgi:hypothetical protein